MVLLRPLQHRQVPADSGRVTRPFIPRAAIHPRPPQDVGLPTPSWRRMHRCSTDPTGSR
jgi:hypothetical protein